METRRPSWLQYFFARDWPLKAYLWGAALAGLWVAINAAHPSAEMFRDWQFDLAFGILIIVAPVLAYFLALLFGVLFVPPIYQLLGKLNGAPFQVGDQVRILVGPHRDRVVPIYAVWKDRLQVRVELDEQAKKDVTDVFSHTQVCREKATVRTTPLSV